MTAEDIKIILDETVMMPYLYRISLKGSEIKYPFEDGKDVVEIRNATLKKMEVEITGEQNGIITTN